MTDFDLDQAKAAIRHVTGNRWTQAGAIAWDLAHRLHNANHMIAVSEEMRDQVERQFNTIRAQVTTTDGIVGRLALNHEIAKAQTLANSPEGDAADWAETAAAEYEEALGALAVTVGALDQLHVQDDQVTDVPDFRCITNCPACLALEAIPQPLVNTARNIHARIH